MLGQRELVLLHTLQSELAIKRDWVAVGFVQNLIDHIADEHGLIVNEIQVEARNLSVH